VKLSQVDLNLFVVFEAIYAEQNLTRAADILHITQPAVSNALNRLRETLGDPLFVRTARGMRPTPVAQQLAEPVRAALRQLDICLQQQDSFTPASASRVFRLNAGDLAEQMLLPALVRHLEGHGPELRLEVGFIDRQRVPLELAAGNLDVSLDSRMLNHPELNSIRLLQEDYVCALRRDHPLAAQPLTLTLERYLALKHIHISSRVRGAGHVDIALRALGRKRTVALRLQHYVAAPAVLAATDWALSLPRRIAAHWDVLLLPLPFATEPFDLHLYWHKSVDHDPANRWLRETLASLIGSEGETGAG
jgi:DNA-binding transcriptional LysR family regulator